MRFRSADGGIAPPLWAVILLVIATAIGLVFSLKRRDIAYGLVLVWAFAGIVVEQSDTQLVAVSAGIAAIVMAIAVGVAAVGRMQNADTERI